MAPVFGRDLELERVRGGVDRPGKPHLVALSGHEDVRPTEDVDVVGFVGAVTDRAGVAVGMRIGEVATLAATFGDVGAEELRIGVRVHDVRREREARRRDGGEEPTFDAHSTPAQRASVW
ncbi:MAG: hypothetical protein H6720_20655 [Sandaracinus sp.]|nr:hypothetical protein [Sandaracinus sp.]MCB9622266.1 hypothetical protein [Sandaracinus sp.]